MSKETKMNSILDQPLSADPPRKWSEFQESIFDSIAAGGSSLLVQAVAGSGKTTTIVEGVRRALGSSLFLAFNKSIAEELRSRIGSAGECKTLNALGHRLWMINRPSSKLDIDKLKKITSNLMNREELNDFGYIVQRAVGLGKNNALGIGEDALQEEFEALIDNYFDVPAEHLSKIASWALAAFTISLKDEVTFDFDDQVYGPILHNWQFPLFSNVFVDECQDLSPIQHLMLLALTNQGARIIGVGDRHQAIYGFRGASRESMDLLKERFKMAELPLSITYRCPQSVVTLAQRYCPEIRAKENAPAGSVCERFDETAGIYDDPELWKQGLVICRTNAPLFRAILRHIRAREPCRVLSNFLDSFQSFIRSLARGRRGGAEATRCSEVLQRLDRWFQKECEAAEGRRGKLAHLRDKYETAKLILSEYSTVSEACEAIKRLAACRTGPTFATVHKAKGLESESVYILRPDLMPSPWAQGEQELLQEDNLSYVAITRTISSLTWGIKG
jgi:DNA helicase II / ATP-dependent DNA helicase PcrA